MKKVAILTSGFAPVPAVDNGAVEMLTTFLIDDNEKDNVYNFDVYTIADSRLDELNYKNTKIIQIKLRNIEKQYERVINGLRRRMGIKKLISFYNKKLIKLLKNNKYDILIFENSMDLIDLILSKKIISNYVLHLHNDLNDSSKTPRMAQRFIDNKATIICVSDYIKRSVISKTIGCEKQCKVLYNCIDFEKKQEYNMINKKSEKEKLLLRDEDFVLLFVGRLNKEKGILELAKAFNRVKNKRIKLIVCGGTWGSEFRENSFVKQVRQAFGERINDVIFTGYIKNEEMLKYYSIADCVIIPSIVQESFGMVMLESVIYEKPIIATKSGGMVEIVSKDNALWVNIDNDIDINIANMIEYAYGHEDVIKNNANNAYQEILNKKCFYRENYLKRMNEIIED